jgi:thioredoxin-related protein
MYFLTGEMLWAQDSERIHWISFEQLDDSLTKNPKPVLIYFYTDWCTYCRKMDKKVFPRDQVTEKLNQHYYAVKMDAETQDTISFDGRTFINDQLTSSRKPVHQLVQLLATRNGQFVPPALMIMDEEFKVVNRYFHYLNSTQLLTALNGPLGN